MDRGQKTGSVVNFRKLNMSPFYRTEEHMRVKQWLVDTENLLGATRVEDEDCVKVIKIQFMNITRT